jgi:hypothetical protein
LLEPLVLVRRSGLLVNRRDLVCMELHQ